MDLCAFWLLPLLIYLRVYCIISVAFFYLSTHHKLYKVAHCYKASQRHPILDLFCCLWAYICFLVHGGLAMLESHFVLVLGFNISQLCYSMIIIFSLMVTFVSFGHAAGVFSSGWVIQTALGMRANAEHCSPRTGWEAHLQPPSDLKEHERTCTQGWQNIPKPGEQTCASKPTKVGEDKLQGHLAFGKKGLLRNVLRTQQHDCGRVLQVPRGGEHENQASVHAARVALHLC